MYVLTPFQHDGAESEFYQAQGGKESAGTCPYDDDLRAV